MTPAWIVAVLLVQQPVVVSDSQCPSTRDIEANLAVLLPATMARSGTVAVVTRSNGLGIHLRPEGTEQSEERSVAVGPACDERAKAAAVAIATWWPTTAATKTDTPEMAAVVVPASDSHRGIRRVKVAAGAFASVESDGVAPGVRAEVQWAPWDRAIAFRLGIAGTGAHGGSLGPGQVQFRRTAGEVGMAWLYGPFRLDGAAVVSLLVVEGQGYQPSQQTSGASLGVSAGARWAWPEGRVSPWIELRGVGWPQRQRMSVTDVSTGIRSERSLPWGELQLGAGLAVSFR